MRASVVICTWNRAGLLRATLERIARDLVLPPAMEWELIVVDNGSTDATPEVVEEFRARLPIRSALERRLGHSHARNRGIDEARGDYVLWTDDDVLVEPDWLVEYLAAFDRYPDAAVFGGPIVPWFPNEPPRWVLEALHLLQVPYALRDLGPHLAPLDPARLPFGANMAIRTDVQRRFPYDPAFGNRGNERLAGEETRVMRSILAAGGAGWWVPSARVGHYLPEERLSIAYLLQYYRARGVRLRREQGAPVNLLEVARWRARVALGSVAFRIGAKFAPAPLWVRALRTAAIAQGYLNGAPKEPDRLRS